MAQVMNDFPTGTGRGGRPATYPYDQWLDGQVWKLTRGEDFDCKRRSIRAQIIAYAKTRGIKVETRSGDEDTIYVKALLDD